MCQLLTRITEKILHEMGRVVSWIMLCVIAPGMGWVCTLCWRVEIDAH